MSSIRCSVCDNGFLRATIDRLLDEKMSFVGIERYAGEAGIDISADVVSRHARHYKPDPEKPKGTPKRDFAIVIRDRAMEMVDRGELALDNKNLVPGINAGLKAQSIIDGREKAKTKQQSAELAWAIINMLGGTQPAPLALDDGLTIDGDYEEVDGVSD